MFGDSYQSYGRLSVRGMWPPNMICSRMCQWPKFGNDTIAVRPMRSMCSSTTRGLAGRLQRLRQDDVVERVVGIVRQVGVGVALDHRETLGDAFVHALARKLDAAAVDAARLAQEAAAVRRRRSRRRAPWRRASPCRRPTSRSTRAPPGVRAASAMVRSRLSRASIVTSAPAKPRAWRRLRGSRARSRTAPARRAGRRRGPCRSRSRRRRRARRRH